MLDSVLLGNGKRQYLFLLSHMRSYSSLLSHLLGSSEEIDGYGETHTLYRNTLDLWRLWRRVYRSTGALPRARWILDKILQDYISTPDQIIPRERLRAVIFIRQPKNTIRSIVTMLRNRPREPYFPLPTTEWAAEYYISRLHRLRLDSERLGNRAIYFDAEALISNPKETLNALSDWLQLKDPLSDNYIISRRTGEFGFGDPSENIYSGKILSEGASTKIAEEIDVPGPILLAAEATYFRCRASIIQNCQVLHHSLCHHSVDWKRLIQKIGTMSDLA